MGLSLQSFAILPKIAEVDAVLTPARLPRVVATARPGSRRRATAPDLGEVGHRPWIADLSRDVHRSLVAGRNVNLRVVGTLRIVRAGEPAPKPPWLDADLHFDMPQEPLLTIHYTMSAELHQRLS
jgi:hypothetical protein